MKQDVVTIYLEAKIIVKALLSSYSSKKFRMSVNFNYKEDINNSQPITAQAFMYPHATSFAHMNEYIGTSLTVH